MKYLVRTNCEYSTPIEAENAEEAITKAACLAYINWESSWASLEAAVIDLDTFEEEG